MTAMRRSGSSLLAGFLLLAATPIAAETVRQIPRPGTSEHLVPSPQDFPTGSSLTGLEEAPSPFSMVFFPVKEHAPSLFTSKILGGRKHHLLRAYKKRRIVASHSSRKPGILVLRINSMNVRFRLRPPARKAVARKRGAGLVLRAK